MTMISYPPERPETARRGGDETLSDDAYARPRVGDFRAGLDRPLNCNWRFLDPGVLTVLDLPAATKAAANTRANIIAEAFVVGRADPHKWISYSRRRAFYAVRSRYWPPTYTYDNVVYAVDQLAAAGFLEHQKAAPGQRGRQSRFRAASTLINELNNAVVDLLHAPHEVIILRDIDKNLIDYDDTSLTRHWRRNLEKINEALRSATLGLQGNVY